MTKQEVLDSFPPCQATDFLTEVWSMDTQKQLAATLVRWEEHTKFYHSHGSMWVRLFADGSLMGQPETGLPIIADVTQTETVYKTLGWH